MEQLAETNIPLMDHAQDPALAADGVIHEGDAAVRHGLPAIPSAAEFRIVERDIAIARETGCRVHVQHLSAAESVELIRHAREQGVPVSAELTPHHLALTEEDVRPDDTNFKMNPPLGSARDRQALQDAIIDGTISAFATDHAPHTQESKQRPFVSAPFGVVGLETAIGVTYTTLVRTGRMEILDWVERWTTGPAAVLGMPPPSLLPGQPADLAILDLDTPWTVDPGQFASRSRNTPFRGHTVTGRSVCTISRGNIVWVDESSRGG
jgi:dihydroorotase